MKLMINGAEKAYRKKNSKISKKWWCIEASMERSVRMLSAILHSEHNRTGKREGNISEKSVNQTV
jgi:hypothetical protein